eukprot:767188-Hanusia_phi.AAC.6
MADRLPSSPTTDKIRAILVLVMEEGLDQRDIRGDRGGRGSRRGRPVRACCGRLGGAMRRKRYIACNILCTTLVDVPAAAARVGGMDDAGEGWGQPDSVVTSTMKLAKEVDAQQRRKEETDWSAQKLEALLQSQDRESVR